MSYCKNNHDTIVVGRTKSGNCKECMKQYLIDWHKKYPEYNREYSKEYKRSRGSYYREYDWKRKGVLNPDGTQFLFPDKDKLFEKQDGKCAICYRPDSTLKHTLAADHDHKTNIIRGLLCDNCNKLLGHSFDSPVILERAIEYLKSQGIKI